MNLVKKENNRMIFIDDIQINIYDTKSIVDTNNIDNLQLISQNTRYSKYIGQALANIELLIIQPYNDADKIKYSNKLLDIIEETANYYFSYVYPKIVDQDKSWIIKILNKENEAHRIIYEDSDFILMPDITMHNAQIDNPLKLDDLNNIHYLAIIKRNDILSLRDLNEKHIDMLGYIDTIGKKEICKLINKINPSFNVQETHIRSYVHYRPSFWHLHIHFDLTGTHNSFSNMDFCHMIHNVIQNIKLCNDYYQKATLRVCIKDKQ